MTTERLVYTVAQAAARIGRHEATIRREIKAGRLRARKLRTETVILDADLQTWLARLPVVATEATDTADTIAEPTPIDTPTRSSRRRVVRRFEPFGAAQ